MNYTHLTGLNAGASITKAGAKLHSVTINQKGTASNLLTFYDNALGDTSGNVIAIIDTTSNVCFLLYDVDTLKGLSYASAAGTMPSVTVAWQ